MAGVPLRVAAARFPAILSVGVRWTLDLGPVGYWFGLDIDIASGSSTFGRMVLQASILQYFSSRWYAEYVEPEYIYCIPDPSCPPDPPCAVCRLNLGLHLDAREEAVRVTAKVWNDGNVRSTCKARLLDSTGLVTDGEPRLTP